MLRGAFGFRIITLVSLVVALHFLTAADAIGNTLSLSKPIVVDDGVCSSDNTRLHAAWSSADGNAVSYKYAVGNSPSDPCGGYVIDWTSTKKCEVAVDGLTLTDGHTYYFYVKAIDKSGNVSDVGVSDGIKICVSRTVAWDLLGGIGNFEIDPCYTNWVSGYAGGDYNWNAQGRWSYGSSTKWGYNVATPDDSVAEGWSREGDRNPEKNYIYRLAVDGGSKCQYFALKNVSNSAIAYLKTSFPVSTKSYQLNVGDTVTFSIDKLRMDDYGTLNLSYALKLTGLGGDSKSAVNWLSKMATSGSVSGIVNAGTTRVNAWVIIQCWGGGTKALTPGIYVDNAHLTVVRNGQQVTETVPVKTDRKIKTIRYFVTSSDDPASTARNFDYIDFTHESDYWFARRLKYYNPNIKCYLYEGPWVCDWRETAASGSDWESSWRMSRGSKSGKRDNIWSNTSLGLEYVLNHDQTQDPDWLYPNGSTYYGLGAHAHYANLGDSTFDKAWVDSALTRVADYKLDGLLIDGPIVKIKSGNFPGIEPWEEQKLLHTVMDSAPAGIDVLHNICAVNLVEGYDASGSNPWLRWPEQGLIFCDPTWKPHESGEYTAAKGYRANSASNTVDGLFQEYAYFMHSNGRNHYKTAYALNCLNDMDAVKKWNSSIPVDHKKWAHMMVSGDDIAQDPADGIDGWANFGLCNYLLGQNEWTTLGIRVINGTSTSWPYAPLDETANLGLPAGNRTVSGNVCQRRYFGADDGATGGVVVANLADSLANSYVPTFDVVDQEKKWHPAGLAINLSANKGRILYHQNNYKYVSVVISPAQNEKVAPEVYRLRGKVVANRPDIGLPSVVQVKIDNGAWTNCSVDSNGNWGMAWDFNNVSTGEHSINCRAYVRSTDYEPTKQNRTFRIVK